jgi:hypothetical protein
MVQFLRARLVNWRSIMASHSERSSPALEETTARREFLGRIGKAAVTAPAVALLLAASAEPAAAQTGRRYRPSTFPPIRPRR